MKLADILTDEVAVSSPADASNTDHSVSTSKEEVEKIASMLDAYSEQDTLLDELAKLAVLSDMLEQEGAK